MSELINNAAKRKELLKHMILQLHKGEAPEQVKSRLAVLLQKIPYDEVVEVEQELINEGLPAEEVLRLCDIHTQVLKGVIDLSGAKEVPKGHPVDTFLQENNALLYVIDRLKDLYTRINETRESQEIADAFEQLHTHFNSLMDVNKHYQRKENLLFPYMEKREITGPPKVMWGKHDETRALLKKALAALRTTTGISSEEARTLVETILEPASTAVADMTMKEGEILLPMCMDTLTDAEWFDIYQQTPEIGFCLYDPQDEWKPEGIRLEETDQAEGDLIRLPSGSFTHQELQAILNTLPVDITFVDQHDKVKYFSQSSERIFARTRSILQRDVRLCHPPTSVHVVEQILDDFKSGKADRTPFWIQMDGKFIHIEYFALRDAAGNYLGTLEVSQDLTEKRRLEDEQRLLSYEK